MYITYRRCHLQSGWLSQGYKRLTQLLALIIIASTVRKKAHLELETVEDRGILFGRLAEEEAPRCSSFGELLSGQCIEWSWLEAVESAASTLFLATYAEEQLYLGGPHLQQLPVQVDGSKSERWESNASHSFYIAEPEKWQLVLEHRLHSKQRGEIAGQLLSGFLRSSDRKVSIGAHLEHLFEGIPEAPARRFGPWGEGASSAVQSGQQRVIIRIQELLDAAGVGLNSECELCPEFNKTGEKAFLRRIGLELDVTLFYSNLWTSWFSPWTWWVPASDITFEVHVSSRQPMEGVRQIRTVRDSPLLEHVPEGTRSRVVRRLYGIRMNFHQSGVVGRFELSHFVAFLMSSITTLTVAWTVMEALLDFTPPFCRATGWKEPAWFAFFTSQTERQPEEQIHPGNRKDKKNK